ncbi:MAG: hypothetical protein JSW25_08830 [Thermoplasmata archaeon]|nr:MAG: hypothetical protein JSW25_08830 [Thermoplasmata archaeon]
MDNICRDCGRKFHSDLRFCPHCGGDAMPPRTNAWRYRATGMIAHTDPVEEKEIKAYKQNGWLLLCLGILLIPFWLFGLVLVMEELGYDDPDLFYIVAFIIASGMLAFVFIASGFAFQARRPGSQMVAALMIVMTTNGWHPIAWVIMVGLFLILIVLYGRRRGTKGPYDPTLLPLMSGLAVVSVVFAMLWFLTAPLALV